MVSPWAWRFFTPDQRRGGESGSEGHEGDEYGGGLLFHDELVSWLELG